MRGTIQVCGVIRAYVGNYIFLCSTCVVYPENES
jgi:hypothetical protein